MFPKWRSSIYVSIIVFAWWLAYATLTSYVIRRKGRTPGTTRTTPWAKYPLREFMACTGETCMTLFALTFLPGPIAGIMQLVRGSASKPFGRFMGGWLDMRKEFGLSCIFLCEHARVCGSRLRVA